MHEEMKQRVNPKGAKYDFGGVYHPRMGNVWLCVYTSDVRLALQSLAMLFYDMPTLRFPSLSEGVFR